MGFCGAKFRSPYSCLPLGPHCPTQRDTGSCYTCSSVGEAFRAWLGTGALSSRTCELQESLLVAPAEQGKTEDRVLLGASVQGPPCTQPRCFLSAFISRSGAALCSITAKGAGSGEGLPGHRRRPVWLAPHRFSGPQPQPQGKTGWLWLGSSNPHGVSGWLGSPFQICGMDTSVTSH